jgi:hypothetical protein
VDPWNSIKMFLCKDNYDILKELLMQLFIMDKPELIYNAEEKECMLRLNKEPKVLDQKGARRVHIVAHEHGGRIFQ